MTTMNPLPPEPQLKVLICDTQTRQVDRLTRGLLAVSPPVVAVSSATTIDQARALLRRGKFNTIFIDVLSLGLSEASDFIFDVRKKQPEIVFVLFVDRSAAERHRTEFFEGERRRFSHYHYFDKGIPAKAFDTELKSEIKRSQAYLRSSLSSSKLKHLGIEPPSAAKEVDNARSVFLSHRFAEKAYVRGLTRHLKDHGFEVVTGQSANTYVSHFVIDQIRRSAFFLCLMTRADRKVNGKFTTSAWLLEEKGVALALGKPLVMMVEHGVADFGGLQGDWQIIHFKPKEFLDAAHDAVEQLKSYVGGK